jgi:ferritin-like metal-binding protein YciE
MAKDTIDDQLNAYLADAHSIEEQALAQLRTAPDIAGREDLAAAFRQHLTETERHERLVRERLEARGGTPSRFKKLVMEIGGKGFILFARSQPDTPGKLTAHAYSYEALEQGAYEMLARMAHRAGDEETAALATDILADEYAMADRLAQRFDSAVEASLKDPADAEATREQLLSHLADAHALEKQSIGLLENGQKIAGDPQLSELYRAHLGQSRDQQRLVEERLAALGGRPSRLKDAAMRLGALNWGGFFAAHPDTPGKLAVFAYAFEHLEIAGYELLARTAHRAGDEVTAELARRIAEEERATAEAIRAAFDRALDASLGALGLAGSARR